MLFGVLWALDFPARRTALYTLVGSRRVATAISLETVSMQVAKMVGPVLAGVGLAHLGPAPCYAGVAALYAIGLLVFVDLPGRIGGPSGRDVTSVVASLGAGFREAWREPTVRAVLLITVMMNVLFFPYQHMLPVFARHVSAWARSGSAAWWPRMGSARCWGRSPSRDAAASCRTGASSGWRSWPRRSCCWASRASAGHGPACRCWC
jgi:hypothetical protein